MIFTGISKGDIFPVQFTESSITTMFRTKKKSSDSVIRPPQTRLYSLLSEDTCQALREKLSTEVSGMPLKASIVLSDGGVHSVISAHSHQADTVFCYLDLKSRDQSPQKMQKHHPLYEVIKPHVTDKTRNLGLLICRYRGGLKVFKITDESQPNGFKTKLFEAIDCDSKKVVWVRQISYIQAEITLLGFKEAGEGLVKKLHVEPYSKQQDLHYYTSEEHPFADYQVVAAIEILSTEKCYPLTGYYAFGNSLGDGGEGTVFKVQSIETGELAVVKKVAQGVATQNMVNAERMIAAKLSRLLGIHSENANDLEIQTEYTFFPFYGEKNLMHLIYEVDPHFSKESKEYYRAKRKLPLAFILEIASGLLTKLKALQEAQIIHRDMNPNNVVCDISGSDDNFELHSLEIVDLGEAVCRNNVLKDRRLTGTPGYVDPEVDPVKLVGTVKLNRSTGLFKRNVSADTITYSYKSDLFGVGTMVAEMLSALNYAHHRIDFREKCKAEQHERPMSMREIKDYLRDIFDEKLYSRRSKREKALILLIHNMVGPSSKRKSLEILIEDIAKLLEKEGIIKAPLQP